MSLYKKGVSLFVKCIKSCLMFERMPRNINDCSWECLLFIDFCCNQMSMYKKNY